MIKDMVMKCLRRNDDAMKKLMLVLLSFSNKIIMIGSRNDLSRGCS